MAERKTEHHIINVEIVVKAVKREDASYLAKKVLERHPAVTHVEILKERPKW